MKIYYLLYEVSPSPHHDTFTHSGGAFINCWVRSNTQENAESIAKSFLHMEGWDNFRLEEHSLPERDWYVDIPESLKQYDQAVEHGDAYITHSWPPGPQEDDSIQ